MKQSMKFYISNFIWIVVLIITILSPAKTLGIGNAFSNNINTPDERIILTQGNPDTTSNIQSGSFVHIYGCAGINKVTLESGAGAKLINFPGNNVITIKSDASAFTVARLGATVTLQNSTDGTLLIIPATKTAQTIIFNDNKSFDLVVLGSSVLLGSQVVGLTATSIIEIPSLTIIDYFPESAPAGSYVFLKIGKSILELEDLTITYNNKELNRNTVIKKGENILQFILPTDAQSGEIQVKSGDEVSNTVQFSILPPVSTPLISQSINPSSVNQIINYKDEVSVTIPPGIIDSTAILKVSAVNNAPPSGFEPFGSNAVDITIDGLKQLNDFIKISVKYDPNRLNPNYSAEEQLMAMRWNDEEKYWTPLPYSVDEVNNTVNIMTDHLCFFAIPPLASIASTLAITGLAGANIAVWTGIGEELENDIYFTPEGNFKLMYSKSKIASDAKLNDITWIGETYNDPLYQISSYKTDHPKFIQDIGNLLEVALKNYVDVNKFKNPVTKPGWLWGTSTNPIIVKIDSRWTKQYAQGEANYEAIWGYIHYPTEVLKAFKDGLSYGVIGHELFHRIEAEYYTLVGYELPANNWWLESTSDYAGYRVAWADKRKIEKTYDESKEDFLIHPISTFEYSPSAFIQFLVEKKGINFKDMIEHVAGGSPIWKPLEMLNSYNKINFAQYYRDFAAWAIFASDSFLKKYSISNIAEKNEQMNMPENAKLQIIFSSAKNDSTINIYKFSQEYQRQITIPEPISVIGNEEGYELDVTTGDFIYLMAANTGSEDDSLSAYVKIFVNGEEKVGTSHTFNLKGGYSAKLWVLVPESRYQEVVGTNGSVILDTVTGLEWQRCSVGQTWNAATKTCDGTQSTFDWNTASTLTQVGGWRTPTLSELATLVYCTDPPPVIGLTNARPYCGVNGDTFEIPTICKDAFPINLNTEESWYWSSTKSEGWGENPGWGWAVSFYWGAYNYWDFTNFNAVRLVKSP